MLKVAIRAVRDRFFKLLEKFKKNEREEARASGIQGIELDEVSMGLTDINERIEEANRMWSETNDKEKERENNERKKALDMRRKATETLSKTKKRKEAEGELLPSKRQRRSTEILAVIEEGIKRKREMAERDAQLRDQELNGRRLERECQQKMITENQNFMKNMLLAMQQQNMQFLGQITELFKNVKKK